MSAAHPVGADLSALLRTLKLSAVKDTLPERAALAKQRGLSHLAFLEAVLADEASRRASNSAALRASKAGLDPRMRIDAWEDLPDVSYDRDTWSDLAALPFLEDAANTLVLGPVGVGKTHLATALGHAAVRRRVPTLFSRADRLFHDLKASRLDNTTEQAMRRLAAVKLLIVDDFALRAMDQVQTSDFYELVVARHRRNPTIWTSNRDPSEWIAQMSDTLLAQAAVDRVTSQARILVVEGPSYRQRHRAGQPTLDNRKDTNNAQR
jgi:DNA replication protein DnaC